MITIARLVGESYDFASGKELGKGFVLTNGISERQVEATPDQITAVLELFGELAQKNATRQQEGSQRVAGITSQQRAPASPTNGQHAPVMPSTEGREPGEEYVDPETGTQSI